MIYLFNELITHLRTNLTALEQSAKSSGAGQSDLRVETNSLFGDASVALSRERTLPSRRLITQYRALLERGTEVLGRRYQRAMQLRVKVLDEYLQSQIEQKELFRSFAPRTQQSL